MEPRNIEILNLKRATVQYAFAWQSHFLRADDLQRFANDRGISLMSDQVLMLWELGLLKADFITAPHTLGIDGLTEVEVSNGDHYHLDLRPLPEREHGWTSSGSERQSIPAGTPWFHPFRYFVLNHLLRIFDFTITKWQSLHSMEGYYRLLTHSAEHLARYTGTPAFIQRVSYWNEIAALIIGLEPLQLPRIDRRFRYSYVGEQATRDAIVHVREVAWPVLGDLGFEWLEELHQSLCIDTQMIDDNRDLHTIIRLGGADFRNKLKGKIGGAVLVRTMTEILRRSCEDAFAREIREEDERGFGMYPEHLKQEVYGAHRILDAPAKHKGEFLRQFGLHPTVRARWYVEGDTEFHAISSVFQTHHTSYVELINLRGRIAEKGYLSIRDSLRRDREAHAFSFISIDGDRSEYVTLVRKAAEDGEICGEFSIATPDFEFGNFSINELEHVLWTMMEEAGALPDDQHRLHSAIDGVMNGKDLFAALRREFPAHANIHKGRDWGARLMQYAWDHPERDGHKRRIVEMAENALRAASYNYQTTLTECVVDPATGRTVRKPDTKRR